MKKILLITDVWNWGGETRGRQIIKHLSNEYNIDIIAAGDELKRGYDLYYFLFHPLLLNKDAKRLINIYNVKATTIVTSAQIYKAGWKKRKERIWKEITDRCVSISANSIIGLNKIKKIYNGKTFYIPRGVDTNDFYFEGWNDTELTACYVGKPTEEKGLETIIRPACEKAGVRLLTNTRNFTNALGVDDMRAFYNQTHVYMVASTSDGTPNPALEAAACGRPIISNYIGNMPEFINDGSNGFLVERKISDYVNKLNWMKNNMNLVKKMGQAAKNTVDESWTWEKTTEYERKMLKEIL